MVEEEKEFDMQGTWLGRMRLSPNVTDKYG